MFVGFEYQCFVFIRFPVLFLGIGTETELTGEQFESPVPGLHSSYRGKTVRKLHNILRRSGCEAAPVRCGAQAIQFRKVEQEELLIGEAWSLPGRLPPRSGPVSRQPLRSRMIGGRSLFNCVFARPFHHARLCVHEFALVRSLSLNALELATAANPRKLSFQRRLR